ncbi:MAG: hypothetical protein LC122_06060 [Chitinophagales bacterium]|nr:hypothetical protein [Chitinophagales bacterium]
MQVKKNEKQQQLKEEKVNENDQHKQDKSATSYSSKVNDEPNIQFFELDTKKGVVKLHTYMSKDSVKIIMGLPHSTNINDFGYGEVIETWKYMGRNNYIEEFTIQFKNGKLKSVNQFRE